MSRTPAQEPPAYSQGAWAGSRVAQAPRVPVVAGAITALLAAAGAAVASVSNPFFLDRPLQFLGVGMAVPALVAALAAAVLGGRRRRAGSRRLLTGLLGAAGLLWCGAALRPEPKLDSVKVLVLGLDGATWDVIDPLLGRGQLPAVAAMLRRGTRAVLHASEPLRSPPLWTTLATGKTPEEHGVHGFRVRASDCRVPRLWDVAEAAGLRVGIYKWLVTYPPRVVPGFLVPAWLAPAPDTWPADLSFVKELELSQRMRRRRVPARRSTAALLAAGVTRGFRWSTLQAMAAWALWERVARPDEQATAVHRQLIRGSMDRDVFVWASARHRPDLATFTYYATDGVAHRYWPRNGMGQGSRASSTAGGARAPLPADGRALAAVYQQADALLDELTRRVGPAATVVVLSDHGFRGLPAGGARQAVPLTKRLEQRLGEGRDLEVTRLGARLVLTLGGKAAALPGLRAAIEGLTDARGDPVFRVETLPDDPRSLGLTLVNEQWTPELLASGTVGGEPLSRYVRLASDFTGEHDPRGILLVAGPGIAAGSVLPDATVLDVAPTVQALLGIPPARDLPGRVLFGDPRRGPDTRDDLVQALRYPEGAAGIDEERLRALGYVE